MIKVLLLGIFIGATIGYITAALMAAPNYSEIYKIKTRLRRGRQ